jgi:soluble lytic murein transglycosylase-like protein
MVCALVLALFMGSANPQPTSAAGHIKDTIYSAAARYGVSGNRLLQVAKCESGLNPNAVGAAGEIGLFQFKPSTFYAYGGKDIHSVKDQANTAARMFAQGLSHHWTCAR